MNIVNSKYNHFKNAPSDINEHLETLYNYSKIFIESDPSLEVQKLQIKNSCF